VVNTVLLVFSGFVAIKIAGDKNWARITYSALLALDVALIFALGLYEASYLEVLVSYLSVAIEILILITLFGAEANQWFRPTNN
jgi:hypothetical protein